MFTFGSKKGFRRREGKAASAAAARRPRLERRNAVKNIDYEISSSSDESTNSGSLDFSPVGQSIFRIGGSIEGEVEHLYRSLGLSGPEDFAIPIAVWEASLKARSSSDILPRSRLLEPPLVPRLPAQHTVLADGHEPVARPPAAEAAVVLEEIRVGDNESEVDLRFASSASTISPTTSAIRGESAGSGGLGDLGIKGTRPPVLTPPPLISALPSPPVRLVLPLPPSMTLPVHDRASSTWDIVRSFAPSDDCVVGDLKRSLDSDEEDDVSMDVREGADEVLDMVAIAAETSDGSGSFSTSIDDDSSSTTTEVVISPSGRFKKQIRSWMRGQLLGSGSFGTVYEGISDDGTFIAVKEVSLLDKGSNAQQCILQLEQEIALLSQFEHENIVQYYGTDKEESKLFIFLELVTQGSLASLYQKYHLRDTQVSAYTRQILHGLDYLHERDVVHRDIKCANILVHADGSIKLADFGLAKEISKFNDLKSCKGSVYWMAPEVVHPKKTYGRAADIWSLGCTVLEMLTRQIPYPNLEWQHAFYRIGRGDQPPIPSHLSMDAQDFIRKCVQVDPSARPIASQLLEHPFVSRRPLQTLHY